MVPGPFKPCANLSSKMGKIQHFDGLRGIAATVVFYLHLFSNVELKAWADMLELYQPHGWLETIAHMSGLFPSFSYFLAEY